MEHGSTAEAIGPRRIKIFKKGGYGGWDFNFCRAIGTESIANGAG